MGEITPPVIPVHSSVSSLEDRYTVASGRVFLNGYQVLVRLLMMQRLRDQATGLNTAGFVSGYRGSPLGGVDQTLWKAQQYLAENHITFQPGVNEDLAATAIWGTQQVNLFPGAKYDGVFALWYGKGPGVDRCGDVFRHANAAGTSRHGGVLVVAGDDHAAKSSTLPHQTDHVFKAVLMPVLAPAGVQEYLDFGIHGWALSRYSGCWVAFKAVSDTVETTSSVDVDPFRVQIVLPTDFEMPPDGLSIRWPDPPLVQEKRLLHFKLYAALAYCRANRLNRIVIDSPNPRLGIVTCGKSYLDVRQAFDDLGIDDQLAAEIGIRLYKVGMVWPLEAEGVRHFAEGLEEILVVEEKRQLIEYQLKEELYNWREDVRPRVIGKFDEKGEWALVPKASGFVDHGEWLLPAAGELTPAIIARAIASRIDRFFVSTAIRDRLNLLLEKERALAHPAIVTERLPTYCAGCPHNTSTNVPEGSRALAGIGCHYMATWMAGRNTMTFSHMGGEGVSWVGQAPFTTTPHVFANLGDGTYFHSGVLAIRQAVAAFGSQPPGPLPKEGGDNGSLRSGSLAGPALGRPGGRAGITYKILYNDAVAMTGGQAVDGPLSVPIIAAQLAAEGIRNMVVVTDGTARAYSRADLPAGVPIRHRDDLDVIQRELRETAGVTVLIYDQTCAAEKRRRRKRGAYPDPARRVFINELVCEGCGDCNLQSSCVAVVPVETEFGRKRAIDQSACNKDYSCLKGFCPSLVTIEGGRLKKGGAVVADATRFPDPPLPALPATAKPYGILVAGVGGTGVVTIGALIGMAAHIDGRGVTVLDMTGLAQKGGAVYSHVRIADRPDDIHATRIAAGEADAVIGGDIIVSAGAEAINKMRAGFTRAVVNCAEIPTLDFSRDPDWKFPLQEMQQGIVAAVGRERAEFFDATRIATRLMGDSIATNLFLLGYVWQRGLVPVSHEALQRAIELNAVAVDMNRAAFLWGRRAAHDFEAVRRFALPAEVIPIRPPGVDAIIGQRAEFLVDYQDAAYAQRYRDAVERVRRAEAPFGSTRLTEAVARNYFKLLAYKDEYEVARLFSAPAFRAQLAANFEGDFRVNFHLAPLLLARPDPKTGRIAKRVYGQYMFTAFRWLARLKRLRGTRWDIFGYSPDRRLERELIREYEEDMARLCAQLTSMASDISSHKSCGASPLTPIPSPARGEGSVVSRCATSLSWPGRVDLAAAIASLPEQIRGYGPIKQHTATTVRERRTALWLQWEAPPSSAPQTLGAKACAASTT